MCPDPVVDVGVQGAVETDFMGGRENHWIAGCSDLGGLLVRGDARQDLDGWETYEGDEHRISRFDVHGSVLAVVDDVRICGFTVQAKCSCETDTLHCIVQ